MEGQKKDIFIKNIIICVKIKILWVWNYILVSK